MALEHEKQKQCKNSKCQNQYISILEFQLLKENIQGKLKVKAGTASSAIPFYNLGCPAMLIVMVCFKFQTKFHSFKCLVSGKILNKLSYDIISEEKDISFKRLKNEHPKMLFTSYLQE